MTKLLGPRSGTSWAGRTGQHKHTAFLSRRHCRGSRCGPPTARLRSYHCCNTKVFNTLQISGLFFVWDEILDVIGEKLLPTKAALIVSLNLSMIHWSLSKNMTLEQILPFQITSCAKQQIQVDDLSEERVSAQIRTEQHSDFRWWQAKAWNNVWHDSESIASFATKICSQIGLKWIAMFESDVVNSLDRTSFNFRFDDFLSNLPL